VPKSRPSAAERKAKFVANLDRLMRPLGLSARETARRAGIVDKKRFYRWASTGISRAAHEHDDDLDRLRQLFGLPSVEVLWGELPDASLAEMVRAKAEENKDYLYAYKVLVTLRGLDADRVESFKTFIDDAYEEATREISDEDLMCRLAPDQILERLQQRDPESYEKLMRMFAGNMANLRRQLASMVNQEKVDPVGKVIKAVAKYPDPA